jgi:cell division protein FtsA
MVWHRSNGDADMAQGQIVTAIDVGTTKVCTIIGKRSAHGELKVLGHSVVPCEGLRKGNVADIEATEDAVRASVQEAQEKAGVEVLSAWVGITGSHISFENRLEALSWAGKHGVITAEELERFPAVMAASVGDSERKLLHALPMAYAADGERGIRNPVGMHVHQLQVETHVVTGGAYFVDRLVEAVERAGVKVEGLVLEPLAASEAILTPEEKEQHTALVDIGGGTTDVVVFKDGGIRYTSIIPVGGYQFTNDICVSYNTSYQAAEDAKIKYAHTEPDVARPLEEVTLPVLGRTTALRISRRDICQLTRERAQELARLIKLRLQEAGIENTLSARLVLTGGASQLPGFLELARRTLASDARIGVPNGNLDVPDELRAPAYAASVGILLWAANHGDPTEHAGNGAGKNGNGVVSRVFKPVKNLFAQAVFGEQKG